MRMTGAMGGAFAVTILMTALPANAMAQAGQIDVVDTGDTAWLLISSALVLMMAMPGLALFYGGMARTKNFLSAMIQCGAVAAIASIMWIAIGYTLAFGNVSGGWLGAGNAWMLINLGNVRDGLFIPESGFALFHMALAVIAAVLMVGTWVSRARFGWVIAFCALWSLLVYAPVAHWIWGGGWLASRFGTLDFAGGIVVQTTAGVSALAVALLLGRSHGFPKTVMLPHSPALAMAGGALVWIGWLGLTGGSAMAANDDAASAIINTHVAASTAALVWLLIERLTVGKPTGIGFATGGIAGLTAISPAAGLISPGAAIMIGAVAALVSYGAIRLVKQRLRIDDSLDVFAIHGVAGMTGSLLLAFFLADSLGGTGYAEGMTMGSQFLAQLAGIAVVVVWSAIVSVIVALMVSVVLPMRVSEAEELEGIDITTHGERAWELD